MGVYLIELSDQDTLPPAHTAEEQMAWDVLFGRWRSYFGDGEIGLEALYYDAYGGAGGAYNAQTLNRAWHSPTSQWVYWKTDAPDPTGLSYPGPGTFGECTNYGVETIVYVPA